jgi:hypothetical protein
MGQVMEELKDDTVRDIFRIQEVVSRRFLLFALFTIAVL